jgi:hypothetical protein
MEVDSNLNTTVTTTTMTTLMSPLLQDPQARCTVPLLHVCDFTECSTGMPMSLKIRPVSKRAQTAAYRDAVLV